MRKAFLLLLAIFLAAPLHATFSIAAIDPKTGQSAVIVTTRVPFVGRAVPWVRAGVGAVATQSWTVVEYGSRGLDLLARGVAPQDALDQMLADDAAKERRQLGIIDMQGRTASFTGKENSAWAGSRPGKNYTVQGNILVGPEVLDAVAAHLDSTEGTKMPLAERLILALEAGQRKGGDKRWGNFQSAAIRVADPNDPGRGGDHISLAIDVGEHEDPIGELKRIYYRTARRLGYRSFSDVRGSDVVELKRMLHTLGYWRTELQEFPAAPAFDVNRDLLRTDPKRYQEQVDAYTKKAREYEERFAIYDAEAMEAVERFRKEHGLQYEGNARGLVDERLVAALRERTNTRPAADAGAPAYDAELTNVPYPFPVAFHALATQTQQLRMAYLDVLPEKANGRTVLLLHGKNFPASYWEPTIRALTANGFRVIAPDQIGFGKSSKPAAYQFTFHQLAANTRSLLDVLKVERVDVVGHSMGGMLATRFALMYPEVAEKLVLVNPIGLEDYRIGVPYRTIDEWYRQELQTRPESIRAYQQKNYYGGEWKPDYEKLIEAAAGQTRHPEYRRVAWNAALTGDMIVTQPVLYELPLLRVPALLIIGLRDHTAPGAAWAPKDVAAHMGDYTRLGKKTAQAIPGAKLVEIEGVGHLPQVEAFERYRDALLSFLE